MWWASTVRLCVNIEFENPNFGLLNIKMSDVFGIHGDTCAEFKKYPLKHFRRKCLKKWVRTGLELWPHASVRFILESKWMAVRNAKKRPLKYSSNVVRTLMGWADILKRKCLRPAWRHTHYGDVMVMHHWKSVHLSSTWSPWALHRNHVH